MRRFLVGFLASIGFLSIVTVTGVAIGAWWLLHSYGEPDPLPERVVLALTIDDSLEEAQAQDPISRLFPEHASLSLVDMIDAIDQAARDDSVEALVADLSGAQPGMAQAQELRAAVFRFRAAGKPATAYADSFESPGSTAYYLASAFDEIWMQPSGLLGLTGLSLELPLARGLMDTLGLKPEFETRYEYKGAMSFLTDSAFSPALQENYTRIAESLFGQMVSGIASARRMGATTISNLVDQGPLLADEARNNNLIDEVGYRADLENRLTETGLDLVTPSAFLAAAGRPHDDGTRIALLHLDGAISRGGDGPLDRQTGAGSADFDRAVDDVLADDDVRAVILRVSSPGGSFVASDTMRRGVERLREADLPVIASFGDLAASGGYFAALPADHILAHPGTLTGSIGAVGGKVSAADLLAEWDISIGRVEIGDNAGIFSATRGFTPGQSRRMKRILDAIYDDFATKVGEARGLNSREVDAVARGRVWTGEDAQRVGLVDALGGYTEALQLARQSIGIAPDAPVERLAYPREEDPAEALLEALSSGDIESAFRSLAALTTLLEFAASLEIGENGHFIRAEAPHMIMR